MTESLNVAILGATGAVGHELLTLLESRHFPVGGIKLLASARSAGKKLNFKGIPIEVSEVDPKSFHGIDVAFFSAGASRSKEFAQHALDAGAWVIDNSSAYRMDPNVPLVVPEINATAAKPGQRLIAVPNCTAIILLMALNPLRKLGEIDRVIVSTYQSASGGGAQMMHELESQTGDYLAGREIKPEVLPYQYAFNVFSHNTAVNEFGSNEEEWKVMQECRKILDMPNLKLNVTCVRVPVLRAHSESVTVEFKGTAPSEDAIREVLSYAPGVKLVDDRKHNHFPMPVEASGIEEVLVGRIRQDLSNPNAICMFISGDQLWKGAALNAVQIAEELVVKSKVTA